ncbi:MAG: polysaccharide deacetylase family protein [Myxococcales bacterium]
MKQFIPVSALMLSVVGCSLDVGSGDGSGGSNNTTAGTSAVGGNSSGGSAVAGSPSTGGGGAGTAGGSSGTGAGGAQTAGSPATGGAAGASAGGSGTGGSGAGGSGAGGSGAGGSAAGGSGPAATFKCDNLSLAPSMTGVAKPAGAAGGLKVLDWAGFKGAASFTFDDNTPSQLANYAALKATGGHFTWFLIASSAGSGYKATIADGQEIANHTQTHPGSASQAEVTNAQNTLKTNFGVTVNSMAAPNCADAWAAFAAPANLFQNRGPCGNVSTVGPRDNTDPFRLPAYLPATGEASATMSATITSGKWRIFVIHGFDSQNGTYQPVPIANVTASMSKAVTDGFWVEGMTNVGAYWQGQKLIPASASTSATWTLPAKFPPNMCVRITTTGGVVKQKGETIAWDPHGYYQISLDAGAVTVE